MRTGEITRERKLDGEDDDVQRYNWHGDGTTSQWCCFRGGGLMRHMAGHTKGERAQEEVERGGAEEEEQCKALTGRVKARYQCAGEGEGGELGCHHWDGSASRPAALAAREL